VTVNRQQAVKGGGGLELKRWALNLSHLKKNLGSMKGRGEHLLEDGWNGSDHVRCGRAYKDLTFSSRVGLIQNYEETLEVLQSTKAATQS